MEWHERMNMAIEYIESRLTREIDIWEAAKIAWCSEYHFRRMFSFIAGVSVSEYIRRRRLSRAASDLQQGSGSIQEIALRYGYRSTDAFSRAFTAIHGISPAAAMEQQAVHAAWPKMTFYLSIQGGKPMHVKLIEKSAFTIIGLCRRVALQFEGVNPEIEAMWKLLTDEDIEKLKKLSNTEPRGIIQASVNFDEGRMEEQGSLDHYIGAATTEPSTGNWGSLSVAPSFWAVFSVAGPFPQALQETWGRIYSEWFPSASYELSEGPEIVRFSDMDMEQQHAHCEIWIPVKPSEQHQ